MSEQTETEASEDSRYDNLPRVVVSYMLETQPIDGDPKWMQVTSEHIDPEDVRVLMYTADGRRKMYPGHPDRFVRVTRTFEYMSLEEMEAEFGPTPTPVTEETTSE